MQGRIRRTSYPQLRDTTLLINYHVFTDEPACTHELVRRDRVSTIVGPGSLSGWALMALGEVTLRAADNSSMLLKLKRMERIIRTRKAEDWPAVLVTQILEYQR